MKCFSVLLTLIIQVKSLTSLLNIVEKQGNFGRQTHSVNFYNVNKISDLL